MIEPALQISNIPAISAIYFALLQTGYEYYRIEKTANLIGRLSTFQSTQYRYSFFEAVKQTTCEVYPYWPRAAILETASFYIDLKNLQFHDFTKFKTTVMSANNLRDEERSDDLWTWVTAFPKALKQILSGNTFQAYLMWERGWIAEQNRIYTEALHTLQKHLQWCAKQYVSPIANVQIVLNPIKCAYSSDYHIVGNSLVVCSGTFDSESVIHEFIHPVVHDAMIIREEDILRCDLSNLGIDTSYYPTNDAAGQLNAFEEYCVRILTAKIAADSK